MISSFKKDYIFNMMCMWKHINRLYSLQHNNLLKAIVYHVIGLKDYN